MKSDEPANRIREQDTCKLNPRRARLLLMPLTWAYATIARIRNLLFDHGVLPVERYEIPLIIVGNLTLGGTGKTPLTEYLIRLLSTSWQCAMLSRGYGRKTKSTILAGDSSTYLEIGDEPMQLKQKFENLIICLAANRREGMLKLLSLSSPPGVIIMDDGFQHRYVKPGLAIILVDYNRPIWDDYCLPAGNLREPISALKRANVIIVTKCPKELSRLEASEIRSRVGLTSGQQLFFTTISYNHPVPLHNTPGIPEFNTVIKNSDATLVALAGIGNPDPFFSKAKSYNKNIIPLAFRDHHHFTMTDINHICSLPRDNEKELLILTTEKDAVRLNSLPGIPGSLKNRIWYIPIEINFLFNEQKSFDDLITRYVGKNK